MSKEWLPAYEEWGEKLGMVRWLRATDEQGFRAGFEAGQEPRWISTQEDIDVLPIGSLIYAKEMRRPFVKDDEGNWLSMWVKDKPVYDYIAEIVSGDLKAFVLFEPGVSS